MKHSLKVFYRLRNEQGYLINRCNRCGAKLEEYNRRIAGKEPICNACVKKLQGKIYPKSNDFEPVMHKSKRTLMIAGNGKHNWHRNPKEKRLQIIFDKISLESSKDK